MATNQVIASYYDAKTRAVIDKYGPGPRIHYHMGSYPDDGWRTVVDDPSLDAIRRELVAGQEYTMALAARSWEADSHFHGRLLDAGCGLGGGSLYWLDRYDVEVTAVTLASEHVTPIRRFAEDAGVSERLDIVVGDVTEVQLTGPPYDVAVAMEAACYWSRRRWFEWLAARMAPGGVVCLEDIFVCDPAAKQPFDAYWRTDIGSVDEYVADAAASGFELESNDDITELTVPFWHLSVAWNEVTRARTDGAARDRLASSTEHHRWLARTWTGHRIEARLLRFRLRP